MKADALEQPAFLSELKELGIGSKVDAWHYEDPRLADSVHSILTATQKRQRRVRRSQVIGHNEPNEIEAADYFCSADGNSG